MRELVEKYAAPQRPVREDRTKVNVNKSDTGAEVERSTSSPVSLEVWALRSSIKFYRRQHRTMPSSAWCEVRAKAKT